MAEKIRGIPFDANEIILPDGEPGYDHILYSQDFADWWHTYFKNGILLPEGKRIETEMQVTKTGDTTVKIDVGNLVINGRTCFLDAAKYLEIEKSVPGQERCDRVVVELNLLSTVNDFQLLILPGENAAVPSEPELIRNKDIYQISLATLKINTAGIYEVADDRINDELCGISQVLIGVKPPVIEEAINIAFDDEEAILNAQNVQDAVDHLRGQVPVYVKSILLADNWDATTKTYSFESNYPAAEFNISVEAIDCTDAQADEWSKVMPMGSSESNVLKAMGKVPENDIPVLLGITKVLPDQNGQ